MRMDLRPSITRLALDCQEQFEVVIDTLERMKASDSEKGLSSTELADELGRFRIWATNIGALRTGRASLDYRVRDADYLQQNVKSLLVELTGILSEGSYFSHFLDVIVKSLVIGEGDTFSSPDQLDWTSDFDSDISIESGSSSSDTSDRTPNEVTILQSRHNKIIYLVDRLFDASILIRGTSRKFRTSSAAAHVEHDAEGNDLLADFQRVVLLRIKGLYPYTPPWLSERLAEVIAMRRRQFYYQRAHNRGLAQTADHMDALPAPTPKSLNPDLEIKSFETKKQQLVAITNPPPPV